MADTAAVVADTEAAAAEAEGAEAAAAEGAAGAEAEVAAEDETSGPRLPAVDAGHITTELARRLVGNQFPQWSALPLRPVNRQGIDNRSFRLGNDLLVRLPAGDWYAGQVGKEQTWLPRLAPLLPLPIPQPVAQGAPDTHFPYPWSVYRWIDGSSAAEAITDWRPIARPLARFLAALHSIDARGGPEPGEHNFFRGAPVSVYTEETLTAIAALAFEIDRDGAHAVWSAATATCWAGSPRWFHGDMSANNLLTRDGQLCAVIDFGSSGVGDPACDLVIAFTDLDSAGYAAFRRELGLDATAWARGRGWALWKALISLADQLESDNLSAATRSRAVISRVIADHRSDS